MRKKMSKPFDPERETKVLVEEVRSDFRLLAEQYTSITQKLKEHDQEFKRVHGRFDHMEQRFTHLEQRFDKLDNQFTAVISDHEHRLKTIEEK